MPPIVNPNLPHGLGRIRRPDERDSMHLMGAHFKAVRAEDRAPIFPIPRTVARTPTWVGDQGDTSQCVGFSWAGFERSQPNYCAQSFTRPETIYSEALKLDPYPGEDYDGTTVRAGGKWLQNSGAFTEYLWEFGSLDVIKAWIAHRGPVVVGTNWYWDMFKPKLEEVRPGKEALERLGLPASRGANFRSTEAVIRPGTSEMAGGHAWLVYGYDEDKGFFRMQNSWGRGWGKSGRAVVFYDDMKRLLDEDGECCGGVKLKLPREKRSLPGRMVDKVKEVLGK